MTDEQYKQLLRDIEYALLKPRDQEVLLLTRRLIDLENANLQRLKNDSALLEIKNGLENLHTIYNNLIIRLNTYESRLKQLENKPKESNSFYEKFKFWR